MYTALIWSAKKFCFNALRIQALKQRRYKAGHLLKDLFVALSREARKQW